jgi:hypothetical protein
MENAASIFWLLSQFFSINPLTTLTVILPADELKYISTSMRAAFAACHTLATRRRLRAISRSAAKIKLWNPASYLSSW